MKFKLVLKFLKYMQREKYGDTINLWQEQQIVEILEIVDL